MTSDRETIITNQNSSERDTTLRVALDQKTWSVFSEIPGDIQWFKKMFGPGVKCGRYGWEWEIARDDLRLHRKKRVSEKTRKKAGERMRLLRQSGAI